MKISQEDIDKSEKFLKKLLYAELFIFAAFTFIFILMALGYQLAMGIYIFFAFVSGVHLVAILSLMDASRKEEE